VEVGLGTAVGIGVKVGVKVAVGAGIVALAVGMTVAAAGVTCGDGLDGTAICVGSVPQATSRTDPRTSRSTSPVRQVSLPGAQAANWDSLFMLSL
jgi:hypothetical protein